MALFALQAAADAGEPRPPELLAGLATAPGFSSPTRLHVAEHRLQAEQAGIAQGAQFVEADAGEDFHAAQRIGAAQQACSSSLARPAGAGANGGSAALDGMQGRGAALDIALAELAFELGEEVLHVRNEAPQHLDDQLQAAAETPDDIAPRLDQFARVRCRCRRALAPLLPR